MESPGVISPVQPPPPPPSKKKREFEFFCGFSICFVMTKVLYGISANFGVGSGKLRRLPHVEALKQNRYAPLCRCPGLKRRT